MSPTVAVLTIFLITCAALNDLLVKVLADFVCCKPMPAPLALPAPLHRLAAGSGVNYKCVSAAFWAIHCHRLFSSPDKGYTRTNYIAPFLHLTALLPRRNNPGQSQTQHNRTQDYNRRSDLKPNQHGYQVSCLQLLHNLIESTCKARRAFVSGGSVLPCLRMMDVRTLSRYC